MEVHEAKFDLSMRWMNEARTEVPERVVFEVELNLLRFSYCEYLRW